MKIRIPWLALGMLMAADLFAGPITFSSIVNPTFGDLLAGPSGRNFILGTTGAISGADAGDYIQGAAAGSVIVHGDNGRRVDIIATNLTANGGVTIAGVTCKYHNRPDRDCVNGFRARTRVNGRTMLIGVEINTTQVHGDNDTASPTFDIVITYQ